MSTGSTGGADPPPLLVVISGPSGVGKDAVIAAMRGSQPGLMFAVTATTRPMRPGEVDGRDYVFLSTKRFEAMLADDGFLEHAEVYGYRYGVPRQGVRAALAGGRDVIVKIDVQGAATIREIAPDALLIFLAAPSAEELERRLRARKTDPVTMFCNCSSSAGYNECCGSRYIESLHFITTRATDIDNPSLCSRIYRYCKFLHLV